MFRDFIKFFKILCTFTSALLLRHGKMGQARINLCLCVTLFKHEKLQIHLVKQTVQEFNSGNDYSLKILAHQTSDKIFAKDLRSTCQVI